MIIYNWDCRTVDAFIEQDNESDVVYNVHWIVTGVSDEVDYKGELYSVKTNGTQMINTSDIANFIPFDQVTNEEVVAWTKASMGAEEVIYIERSIAGAIESLIHPVSVTLTVGEPII